jgi:diketogulonate reductase-like aldo/keto reductase
MVVISSSDAATLPPEGGSHACGLRGSRAKLSGVLIFNPVAASRRKIPQLLWSRGEPAHFAAETECQTWAELLLKFVVSHPAVTYAIPATSSVTHLDENMRAALGPLPDRALCERIAAAID